ncbi:MAG: SAM-dependent methyltransferase, partial [Thermobifida sp.]|nr:SAM-dependent methyltransferase [Thermobifida sp.]
MSPRIESPTEALPFADRPVDKTPGHWVLARAGKTVLRPGGLALSTWALKRAVLPGADV